MANRKFQTGEFYHIYNRGVDKRKIFMDNRDYVRFFKSMREFNCVDSIGSLYLQTKRKKQELQKHQPLGGSKSHLVATGLVEFICYSFKSLPFFIKTVER